MNKNTHPDFDQEQKHLQETQKAIDNKIELYEGNQSPHAGDEWAVQSVKKFYIDKIQVLENNRSEPYFGRFDISQSKGGVPEQFYIGYDGLDLDNFQVIDWRAPIGKVFYSGMSNPIRYQSPDGPKSVFLSLKRNFEISNGLLFEIFDHINLHKLKPEKSSTQAEEYLHKVISDKRNPKLEDIVRTIQIEQDEIIRMSPSAIVVVNGSAGSGKTSIAYHRIAYLLFPDSQQTISANKVIFFGPNKLFLSYSRELLPNLRVKDVQQTTFELWAKKYLGLKLDYPIREFALEKFLDSSELRQTKIDLWKKARIKTDAKFIIVIEKLHAHQIAKIRVPKGGILIDRIPVFKSGSYKINIGIDYDNLSSTLDMIIQKAPSYTHAREEFISIINSQAETKYMEFIESNLGQGEMHRAKLEINFNQAIRFTINQISKSVNSFWPRFNAVIEYNKFLKDHNLFQHICEDILSPEEIKLVLNHDLSDYQIDAEDLPAILYFHLLGEGKPQQIYDQIVVDEGQDYSLFHYKLFSLFSKSMTILGDLAQGIFRHRGLNDWSELSKVFDDNFEIKNIPVNYRSTKEIVAFTNSVLTAMGKDNSSLSKTTTRDGRKPKLSLARTLDEMYDQVYVQLNEYLQLGIRNIGIISKNQGDCEEVISELIKRGLQVSNNSIFLSADIEFEYEGGIVLTHVSLAKGLEFEAVIVVKADKFTYSKDVPYDGQLLYVAITRGLSYLSVISKGEISPYLVKAKKYAMLSG